MLILLAVSKLLLELKLIAIAILGREIRRLVVVTFFVNVSKYFITKGKFRNLKIPKKKAL